MKNFKRSISFFFILLMSMSFISKAEAADENSFAPGNTDISILNGGTMLTAENRFFYSDNGIYLKLEESEIRLTEDEGRNLNLSEDFLYYTLDLENHSEIKRIPASGGETETVYKHSSKISRLYIARPGEALFISGGEAFSMPFENLEPVKISDLTEIYSLIPTKYGNIFVKGGAFNYSLYLNDELIFDKLYSVYTEKEHLVINRDYNDYQIHLSDLFAGKTDLDELNLYPQLSLFGQLSDEPTVCEECERNAQLAKIGIGLQSISLYDDSGNTQYTEPPAVSEGQRNMVKRARQLHEIKWTPIYDRSQWGNTGTFNAGTTYTGVPYGQAVNTGYVGWTVSLDKFLDSVNNSESYFYTTYSTYYKIAPSYSTDCSAFVSYAWNCAKRKTTSSLVPESTKISEQSIYSLQIGDALNDVKSHVVMVSGLSYNEMGELVGVEIIEQTPVITRLSRYGENERYSLAYLQSKYFGSGYSIYRCNNIDKVTYTHSCRVPIDGDYCQSCKAEAPSAKTLMAENSKQIVLSHSDSSAKIYYTLDGKDATSASKLYTEPIIITDKTTIKAMAVTSKYSDSFRLTYTVSITPAEKPAAALNSGLTNSGLHSRGSTIKLTGATKGSEIYYTLDGSTPSKSSTKYLGPIELKSNTTIKAIAYANGYKPSEAVSFSYTVADTTSIKASAGTGGTISPSGTATAILGGSYSYTITPSSGYEIKDVLVNGKSVGAVSKYDFTKLSKESTISAEFSYKIVNGSKFTDVPQNAWFAAAIDYCYQNELFSGTSSSTFSPGVTMDRGMFSTVLYKMAKQDVALKSPVGVLSGNDVRLREAPNLEGKIITTLKLNTAVQVLEKTGNWYKVIYQGKTGYMSADYIKTYNSTFKDINANQYFAPYVQWSYLIGVSSGKTSSTFAPYEGISRQDMCLQMYNYAQKYKLSLGAVNAEKKFKDDASIPSAYKTAVYEMQKAGVMVGDDKGNFNPASTATRAEVAQVMMNFKNAVK
ncbi:chitobiase/beta-hexosaminidase C-terminal domain-containing protein [Clostridiaceae bacterium OttesenSCG-928-D20]|nr:chitobiase/beta-hexosaminidase C-terminal domain-containing protein [Clostridiaceae bacterium OttesenSCG-928-D20]